LSDKLDNWILAAFDSTDSMQILVFFTEAMAVIQQRLLAPEDTTAWPPHAETITDNGLTFF
jgi:hypothetical protein